MGERHIADRRGPQKRRADSGQGKAASSDREAQASRPNNTRKQLVRDRMLEKSAELFCANGFSRTSINDIADALYLKRSSVYHYFANKEEIVRALFIDEYTRRSNELRDLFDRSDLTSKERLVLATEGAIAQRLRGGSRFLVFDRLEAEVPEVLRLDYNRGRRKILDLYTRIIAEGVNSREFRAIDAQMAAFAVIGMSNWTALWYSPSGALKPGQIAKVLVDLLIHGITRHDGSRNHPGTIGDAIELLRDDLASLERLAGIDPG